jgi:hypothetical protein
MSPSPKAALITFQLASGGGLNAQIFMMKSDGSEVKKITKGWNYIINRLVQILLFVMLSVAKASE